MGFSANNSCSNHYLHRHDEELISSKDLHAGNIIASIATGNSWSSVAPVTSCHGNARRLHANISATTQIINFYQNRKFGGQRSQSNLLKGYSLTIYHKQAPWTHIYTATQYTFGRFLRDFLPFQPGMFMPRKECNKQQSPERKHIPSAFC